MYIDRLEQILPSMPALRSLGVGLIFPCEKTEDWEVKDQLRRALRRYCPCLDYLYVRPVGYICHGELSWLSTMIPSTVTSVVATVHLSKEIAQAQHRSLADYNDRAPRGWRHMNERFK